MYNSNQNMYASTSYSSFSFQIISVVPAITQSTLNQSNFYVLGHSCLTSEQLWAACSMGNMEDSPAGFPTCKLPLDALDLADPIGCTALTPGGGTRRKSWSRVWESIDTKQRSSRSNQGSSTQVRAPGATNYLLSGAHAVCAPPVGQPCIRIFVNMLSGLIRIRCIYTCN